jgi:hypothetical protein
MQAIHIAQAEKQEYIDSILANVRYLGNNVRNIPLFSKETVSEC